MTEFSFPDVVWTQHPQNEDAFIARVAYATLEVHPHGQGSYWFNHIGGSHGYVLGEREGLNSIDDAKKHAQKVYHAGLKQRYENAELFVAAMQKFVVTSEGAHCENCDGTGTVVEIYNMDGPSEVKSDCGVCYGEGTIPTGEDE